MELMTCCLDRKHENLVLFWKIFNSYVSMDYETINNSRRYFSCRVIKIGKYSNKTVKRQLKVMRHWLFTILKYGEFT